MTRYSAGVDEQLGRFLHKADEGKVDALLDALNAMGEDEARRTVAGWMAARRIGYLQERGVTIRPQWGENMPRALVRTLRSGYTDHLYMRAQPDGGTRYVSEPYLIGSEGVLTLASLVKQGWGVRIDGRSAVHFPGDTIYIELTPPNEPDS